MAEALSLPTPQEAVDRLVDLALKGGGPDNVTVVVADVVDDDAAYTDHPLVGGAAAEKGVVPGATPASDGPEYNPTDASAAAKAAYIRRRGSSGDPNEDDDITGMFEVPSHGGRRRDRRRRRRGLIVAGAVVVVLVAGAAAGWAYVRTQYYVGVDHDQVAIFQGVHTKIAGISLSRVQGRFGPVSKIAEPDRSAINETIPVGSRKAAQDRVNGLTKVTPTPAPTPTPRPSATPTVKPTSTAKPKTTTKTTVDRALSCLNGARTSSLPPGCIPTPR
jgi:hypothetical protein